MRCAPIIPATNPVDQRTLDMHSKPSSLHIFSKNEAYFMVFGGMLMGMLITLLFQLVSGSEAPVLLNRLTLVLGELAIIMLPTIMLTRGNIPIREVIPLKSISPLSFFMAVVFVAGVIGLVTVFEVLVLPYFPMPDFLKDLDSELSAGGWWSMLLLLLTAGFIAPLVEEFLFRGILQQSLFYRYGSVLPTLVVPSAIFALFHVGYLFYLPAFIELLMLAVILGWLMLKTGNLWIPIIFHALFNLSAFMSEGLPSLETIETLADLGWSWILLSAILTVLGWAYFKFMPVAEEENVYLIELPRRKEE